jgi:hypothetical protein
MPKKLKKDRNYLDYVKAGAAPDFTADDLHISKHAIQRAKERGIPMEDLRRKRGNKAGYGVLRGKTIVTALTNQMSSDVRPTKVKKEKEPVISAPTARNNRFRIMEIRWKIEDIGVCPSLRIQRPESFEFFRELFQHHPEAEKKRVTEIKDIALKKFGKGPIKDHQDLQFHLHYEDGTSDSISWRKCVV